MSHRVATFAQDVPGGVDDGGLPLGEEQLDPLWVLVGKQLLAGGLHSLLVQRLPRLPSDSSYQLGLELVWVRLEHDCHELTFSPGSFLETLARSVGIK